MSLKIRSGRVSVDLDGDLAQAAEDLLDSVHPGLAKEMRREFKAIFDQARERWPVATGESRDGLQHGLELSRGAKGGLVFKAFIRNTSAHAKYVRSKKVPGFDSRKVHAMTVLMRKPAVAASDRLTQFLSSEIARKAR